MNFIDMHCDTIYKLMDDSKFGLYKNKFSVDIQKMNVANYKAQFFALFIDAGETPNRLNRALDMANRFHIEMEKSKEYISLARNYQELKYNEENNKISAFLTIEEGGVLEGNIDNLKRFYDLGVRLITLTWNFKNEIGYPAYDKTNSHKGLTSFGIEVIEEMNNLGVIIDVSHLSDEGFYDIVKHSKYPFVASHSNARAVQNHQRNLTDEMIKVLSNKGGITGINFCTEFLTEDSVSKIEDMIKHIKHIKNIGGVDVIALGTDFDGIHSKVEIEDASQMDKLIYALQKEKFSQNEIEKICYKNIERVIKDTLK
ncbi:MAG: membrane dipeptidase [Clostridium lundense]|nr:membrane dipeptidase [Clostridium lundense]